MLCVLNWYISGEIYILKSIPNDRFFLENFHSNYYSLSEFLQEICWEDIAEEILFCILFWCLAWDSNRGFTLNKLTYGPERGHNIDMLCVLILYIREGTYSLMSTSIDRFIEKLCMAVLITP